METKYCSCCERELPVAQFSKRTDRRNQFQSHCIECNRSYQRSHYAKNRDDYMAKARKHDKKMSEWYVGIKESLQCSVCGESHIACIQFHHHNGDKEISVSNMMVKGYGKKRILAEMAKCVVLCANCHFKLHWLEKQDKQARSSTG